MNTAVILIILVLSSIGFVQILQYFWRVIISPEREIDCYNVLCINGHIERMEQLLMWFLESAYSSSPIRCSRLIILDLGADEETLRTCEHFMMKHNTIELYKAEEFEEIIKSTDVCKSMRYVLY